MIKVERYTRCEWESSIFITIINLSLRKKVVNVLKRINTTDTSFSNIKEALKDIQELKDLLEKITITEKEGLKVLEENGLNPVKNGKTMRFDFSLSGESVYIHFYLSGKKQNPNFRYTG